jgi:redox-sensing transcriptional repressor
MGIIAVPPEAAQKVAELMVSGGIKAILNFAPTKIVLPAGVQVVQADVSLELVRLAYYLKE